MPHVFTPTWSRSSGPAHSAAATGGTRQLAGALIALTKPRLAAFSVLSALAAYAATAPTLVLVPTLLTLVGTTLAAGGALSLNQWWERETDALMRRTRGRPLPSAAVTCRVALAWSVALSVSGVGLLAWQVNLLAAAFAAATIVLYGLVYTPLKRRTRWATELGSVSGALPALLGSAAAGDALAAPGVILAGVLLCWQMPHFFAIGWMHRDDYRRAGFPLLPAIDPSGERTARWSAGYTASLLIVSLVPWASGHVGAIYGVVATVAGMGMAKFAWHFMAQRDARRDLAARRLFLTTIIYLPAVMAALVIDRW